MVLRADAFDTVHHVADESEITHALSMRKYSGFGMMSF